MNNHGFTSAVGLREISIDSGDRLGLMYVSTKLNRKCNLESTDLLKEFCFAS